MELGVASMKRFGVIKTEIAKAEPTSARPQVGHEADSLSAT